MKLKQLFTDDSAVSPVIGVILMVAITVILAAVIGSFVLNLGGSLQQSAPQATVDYSYDQNAATQNVNVTHTSGDQLENSSISVTGSSSGGAAASTYQKPSGTYSAGDEIVKNKPYDSGETIRLVWQSPEGGSSATISQSTAPN